MGTKNEKIGIFKELKLKRHKLTRIKTPQKNLQETNLKNHKLIGTKNE